MRGVIGSMIWDNSCNGLILIWGLKGLMMWICGIIGDMGLIMQYNMWNRVNDVG